jgi:opacity protein-like surface antigen
MSLNQKLGQGEDKMNKMLLSVFVGGAVLATTVSANPATDFFSNLKYGIRAGGNVTNTSVTTATNFDAKSKLGIAIGGAATYEQSAALSFTSELQYSMKGNKIENSTLATKVTETFKYNYLSVPVYATYKLPQTVAGFRFHALAGGYASYILSAKSKKDSSGAKDQDVKTISDSDYGLLAGVGATYNGNVSVDLRYELGLKEISTISGKNKNITLGVSYLFN